jgi:hypothetical protein
MRSPASKQASILGRSPSTVTNGACLRQLPSRTQRRRICPLGWAGEVEKIFVLTDDDAVLSDCVPANIGVRGLIQSRVEEVLAIKSPPLEIMPEGGGQLVVDQELHDVWSTTWSV